MAKEKETEKRHRLSAEDKARIMSMILLEGKSVSDVADEYRINPNKILDWRKELIEGATGFFAQKRPDITEIDAMHARTSTRSAVLQLA